MNTRKKSWVGIGNNILGEVYYTVVLADNAEEASALVRKEFTDARVLYVGKGRLGNNEYVPIKRQEIIQ